MKFSSGCSSFGKVVLNLFVERVLVIALISTLSVFLVAEPKIKTNYFGTIQTETSLYWSL